MIVTETILGKDGTKLIHTYSNEGKKLLQNETGVIYDDAVDVVPCVYTYTETDEYIEGEASKEDYLEALRDMGVKV